MHVTKIGTGAKILHAGDLGANKHAFSSSQAISSKPMSVFNCSLSPRLLRSLKNSFEFIIWASLSSNACVCRHHGGEEGFRGWGGGGFRRSWVDFRWFGSYGFCDPQIQKKTSILRSWCRGTSSQRGLHKEKLT